MTAATLDDAIALLGQEVPLGRVDRELKKLWDADDAKTRASLMNFAIYSENPDDLQKNNQLLEQIISQNACRALLILCLPRTGEPRARAWINALCRPYQGKRVVCSEQLSFVLEGGDAAQVQNIVFAHLDSDLPLAVWWQGDLTSNFEERFYSEINRLFIDSSVWADPASAFAKLETAYGAPTSDFEVHDLSWTRSHYMRSALAGCFQSTLALWTADRLGVGPRTLGWIYGFVGVISVAVQAGIIGKLTKRFGAASLTRTGALLIGIGMAGLPLVHAMPWLLVALAVFGVGSALFNPSMSGLVATAAAPHERGAVLGAYQGAASLGRVIGPFAASGVARIGTLSWPFVLGAAVSLLGVVLIHTRPKGTGDQGRRDA